MCEAYTNLKIVICVGANQVLFIHVRYTWFTMEALEDTWENLQKIIEVCKLTFSDLLLSSNNISVLTLSYFFQMKVNLLAFLFSGQNRN